jgi:hypothetical protein
VKETIMSMFITVTQLGYTDSEVYGPFESLGEAKEEVTDGLIRGLDGNETRYTFYNMTNLSVEEIGYVLFNDECNYSEEDLREDHFSN